MNIDDIKCGNCLFFDRYISKASVGTCRETLTEYSVRDSYWCAKFYDTKTGKILHSGKIREKIEGSK